MLKVDSAHAGDSKAGSRTYTWAPFVSHVCIQRGRALLSFSYNHRMALKLSDYIPGSRKKQEKSRGGLFLSVKGRMKLLILP